MFLLFSLGSTDLPRHPCFFFLLKHCSKTPLAAVEGIWSFNNPKYKLKKPNTTETIPQKKNVKQSFSA